MRTIIVAALGVFLLAACDKAPTKVGDKVDIGGTYVYLPPPKGYCRMDNDHPSDRRFLSIVGTVVASRGKILIAVAPCGELASWRAGGQRTLDHYGYVMAPLASFRRDFRFSRSYFADKMKKSLAQLNDPARSQRFIAAAKKRAAAAAPGVRINGAKILGVLKSDSDAVHVGVIQDITTEYGKPKRLAGSFGATLVSRKVLFVYLYATYRDDGTVKSVLEAEERWLKGIIESNG